MFKINYNSELGKFLVEHNVVCDYNALFKDMPDLTDYHTTLSVQDDNLVVYVFMFNEKYTVDNYEGVTYDIVNRAELKPNYSVVITITNYKINNVSSIRKGDERIIRGPFFIENFERSTRTEIIHYPERLDEGKKLFGILIPNSRKVIEEAWDYERDINTSLCHQVENPEICEFVSQLAGSRCLTESDQIKLLMWLCQIGPNADTKEVRQNLHSVGITLPAGWEVLQRKMGAFPQILSLQCSSDTRDKPSVQKLLCLAEEA